MNYIMALIAITRPLNVAIAAIAIVIGAITALGLPDDWGPVLWAVLSASLLTAGANTLNDVTDVEVDRVNKPHRPLPGGIISVTTAMWWAIVLMTGGVALAWLLPVPCRIIVLTAAVVIVAYDLWGKGWSLTGNIVVSLVSGTTFIYGSLAVDHGLWGLIPGVMAFFFHFGREIIKDLEDLDADGTAGLKTWPLLAGDRVARHTAQAILVVLLLILALPTIFGWLGMLYLVVVIPGVAVPVLAVIVRLSREQTPQVYGRLQMILKWDMLLGLTAVLVG